MASERKINIVVDGKTAGAESAMGRLGGKVSGAIKNFAKLAGAVGAVALVKMGKDAIATASNIQKSEASLSGLYNSGQKANQMLAAMRKMSAKSPIEYEAFLRGAENLAYLGIEGGQARKIMGRLNTALVATGKGSEEMDRVTNALLSMSNQGKASADTINQASQAGLPLWSMLADHANKSIASVRKDVEDGKVSIEQVLKAIEAGGGESFGKMEKASAKSAKTLDAQWLMFKDNVKVSLGEAARPIVDRMAPAVEKLNDKVKQLGPGVDSFMDGLSGKGGKGLSGFAAQMNTAGQGVKTLVDSFKSGKAEGNGFSGAMSTLGAALRVLWDRLQGLVGTLQNVAQWFMNHMGFTRALAGTILTLVVAYRILSTVMRVQAALMAAGGIVGFLKNLRLVRAAVLAWSAVTKIASAVQAAFNLVMSMNPIGLIIIAIAALAAGLVLAYKKSETFRNIVNGAFSAIQTAALWLWNNAIKPVFGFIGTVFTNIGRAAMWLYNNAIKPAFGFIMAVIRAVGAVISWLWKNIVRPVVTVISQVFKVLAAIIGIVVLAIILAIKGWARIMGWLWNNILKPVFNAIGAVFKWVWNNIIRPVVAWIRAAIQAWAEKISWLWKTIIKPVIDAIGGAFRWVWNNIIQPVVRWVRAAIQSWADKLSWLWNKIIKPVMDWIGDKVKGVWEKWIQPAFRKIKDGAASVGKAFENAKDTIKGAWDKIVDVAKWPVRFIIGRVINDGIIGTFNWLSRKVGGKKAFQFEKVKLPKGFARGGSIPGPYLGPEKDNVLIRANPGEFMQPVSAVKHYGTGFMEAVRTKSLPRDWANDQTPRYAKGGRVRPIASKYKARTYPGHRRAGAYDFAAPTGTRVAATEAGSVATVKRLKSSYGNHVILGHKGGWSTLYAHLSRIAVSKGKGVKANSTVGAVGSTGNSSGPHLHFEARKNGKSVNALSYLKGAAASSGGFWGGVGDFITNSFKQVSSTAKGMVEWGKDKAQAILDFAENPAGVVKHFINNRMKGWLKPMGDSPLINNILGTTSFFAKPLEWVKNKAVDIAKGLAGSSQPGPGKGVERWRNVALQALKLTGSPAGWIGSLLRRMNQESGGNPRAVNNWDSNAKRGTPSKGLMQTIGPTFNAYAGKWRSRGIFDPLANIIASIRYANARYGSAPRGWNRPGGYDNGGWLQPGWTSVYNGTGKPELATPADKLDELGGQTIVINIDTVYGSDAKELAKNLAPMMRDELNRIGRRNGGNNGLRR